MKKLLTAILILISSYSFAQIWVDTTNPPPVPNTSFWHGTWSSPMTNLYTYAAKDTITVATSGGTINLVSGISYIILTTGEQSITSVEIVVPSGITGNFATVQFLESATGVTYSGTGAPSAPTSFQQFGSHTYQNNGGTWF